MTIKGGYVWFEGAGWRKEFAAPAPPRDVSPWPEAIPETFAEMAAARRCVVSDDDPEGPLYRQITAPEAVEVAVGIVVHERGIEVEGMSVADWDAAAVTGARALDDVEKMRLSEFEEEQKALAASWETALIRRGHVPVLDKYETLDVFVLSENHCNGPGCSVCGFAICQHCHEDPEEAPIPECAAVQAENEERERAQLARLLAKYGVPKEWRL